VIEASLFGLDCGAFDVAYTSTSSSPCSSLAKQGIAFGFCACVHCRAVNNSGSDRLRQNFAHQPTERHARVCKNEAF